MQVGGGLAVDRDPIGAGVHEPGRDFARAVDHQMDVQGQAGDRLEPGHEARAEGQAGDEVAVHDVDVDPVGSPGFGGRDRLGQAAEIGREEGRRDEDHATC